MNIKRVMEILEDGLMYKSEFHDFIDNDFIVGWNFHKRELNGFKLNYYDTIEVLTKEDKQYMVTMLGKDISMLE